MPVAKEIFDAQMPQPNQIDRQREDVHVTARDLLAVPHGEITDKGLAQNVDVGIQYMAAWLTGNGCVPIYNLMEDSATAEISRAAALAVGASSECDLVRRPQGDGRVGTRRL